MPEPLGVKKDYLARCEDAVVALEDALRAAKEARLPGEHIASITKALTVAKRSEAPLPIEVQRS